MVKKTALIIAVCCAFALAADQNDIEYGKAGGTALLLDLHVPDGPGPFPAAILIHGGGFDQGSRKSLHDLMDTLTPAGFAWFNIDYRLAPKVKFFDVREDISTAIRWVKSNNKKYHLDPARLVIIGESAGGFLVNYAGTHEKPDTKVAAVVDMYGPVDYGKLVVERRDHPERFNMKSISAHAANGGGIHYFGLDTLNDDAVKTLWKYAPIAAVHKGMPPFLAIHGTKDDQVPYPQSVAMCDAMHKVGATCDIITIEGGGHGTGSWKAPDMQHWKPEMVAWLKKTLKISE